MENDVSKLEIVADVLSTDAAQIPEHARVLIKRWGRPEVLNGVVRTIEPGGYTKVSALGVEEQRTNVIIDITTPHEVWKSLGDSYQVDVEIIIFESPRELVVPMNAIFRERNDWAVFIDKRGRAVKQIISIKRHSQEIAVIEKGLKEGDRVVLYPGSLIHDGSRISTQ